MSRSRVTLVAAAVVAAVLLPMLGVASASAAGPTAGAVAGVAVGAGPAHIGSHPSSTAEASARVEREVRGILRNNPGSHRVGVNAVQVGEGVVMRVPVQPNSVLSCPTYWLCLNQHANFLGYEIDFYYCADRNLGYYTMPNGVPWYDQVSSIRNAQSSGVQSRFYNYDGTGDPNDPANWRFVIALNSGHYLRDLSQDTSADGGNANDKIDIVHVC